MATQFSTKIRRGLWASGRVDPMAINRSLDYCNIVITKPILVVPARPVHGGLEPPVCNPNAVSGIECPIQGLLSSQSAQS